MTPSLHELPGQYYPGILFYSRVRIQAANLTLQIQWLHLLHISITYGNNYFNAIHLQCFWVCLWSVWMCVASLGWGMAIRSKYFGNMARISPLEHNEDSSVNSTTNTDRRGKTLHLAICNDPSWPAGIYYYFSPDAILARRNEKSLWIRMCK